MDGSETDTKTSLVQALQELIKCQDCDEKHITQQRNFEKLKDSRVASLNVKHEVELESRSPSEDELYVCVKEEHSELESPHMLSEYEDYPESRSGIQSYFHYGRDHGYETDGTQGKLSDVSQLSFNEDCNLVGHVPSHAEEDVSTMSMWPCAYQQESRQESHKEKHSVLRFEGTDISGTSKRQNVAKRAFQYLENETLTGFIDTKLDMLVERVLEEHSYSKLKAKFPRKPETSHNCKLITAGKQNTNAQNSHTCDCDMYQQQINDTINTNNVKKSTCSFQPQGKCIAISEEDNTCNEVQHFKTESVKALNEIKILKSTQGHTGPVKNKKTSLKSTPKEKPFRCGLCSKSFFQKAHLQVHNRVHSEERPFKCSMCTKEYKFEMSLRRHKVIHTGEMPFKCEVCKKAYKFDSNLRTHLQKHSGERPYICGLCNETFGKKYNLQVHMRGHSGEKPFKCDVCCKSFSQNSHLQVHSRIHSGEQPFQCDGCSRSFKTTGNLNRHRKIHFKRSQ